MREISWKAQRLGVLNKVWRKKWENTEEKSEGCGWECKIVVVGPAKKLR